MRKMSAMILTLCLMWVNPASAANILFSFVGNDWVYEPNGLTISGYLAADPSNTVTNVNLEDTLLNPADLSVYDQIWVYDLEVGLDDTPNQVANYATIANWFDSANHDLIVDGRIISSNFGFNEPAWIQNYASELDERNGGLVLGTDHANPGQDFGVFVDGINTINDLIGVGRFNSFFGGREAIVDPASPLYTNAPGGTHPCSFDILQDCIYDNSTTSFVATGQQLNPDIFLTPVAYHGNISPDDFSSAFDQAAVASTLGSRTFGTCGEVGQPPCDVPEPSIIALFATALFGLGFARRRMRR